MARESGYMGGTGNGGQSLAINTNTNTIQLTTAMLNAPTISQRQWQLLQPTQTRMESLPPAIFNDNALGNAIV